MQPIPKFDWSAERDALRAPAYFRNMVTQEEARTLRGLSIEERVAAVLARREYIAARLAGRIPVQAAPAVRKVKPGPGWHRFTERRLKAAA